MVILSQRKQQLQPPTTHQAMRDQTEHGSLAFVALGGIWLDEICTPGKETLHDVPGGSVAFGKMYFSSSRSQSQN